MCMFRKAYAELYKLSVITHEWRCITVFVYLMHRIMGSAIDFQLDNIDIKSCLYDDVD